MMGTLVVKGLTEAMKDISQEIIVSVYLYRSRTVSEAATTGVP